MVVVSSDSSDFDVEPLVVENVVRPLWGGSQSKLVRCSNGQHYILKLNGSAQGPNVLANEWIGSRIAAALDVPIPQFVIIKVSSKTLHEFPQLAFDSSVIHQGVLQPGLHFGSQMLGSLSGLTRPTDYISRKHVCTASNPHDFVAVRILDIWADTRDRRETIWLKNTQSLDSTAYFIDHGHMFAGPKWEFGSSEPPFANVMFRLFETSFLSTDLSPFLIKMEDRVPTALDVALKEVPRAWYKGDIHSFRSLYMRRLENLRKLVRKAQECSRAVDYEQSGYLRISNPGRDPVGVGYGRQTVPHSNLVTKCKCAPAPAGLYPSDDERSFHILGRGLKECNTAVDR